MSKTRDNTASGRTDSELSPTTIFELLAKNRRQLILSYLTQAVGAVPISDLADQIALWEGEHTREQYERVCTSLVHVHLPKLADVGVIEYDRENEMLNLQESADQILPYLELATPTSSQ